MRLWRKKTILLSFSQILNELVLKLVSKDKYYIFNLLTMLQSCLLGPLLQGPSSTTPRMFLFCPTIAKFFYPPLNEYPSSALAYNPLIIFTFGLRYYNTGTSFIIVRSKKVAILLGDYNISGLLKTNDRRKLQTLSQTQLSQSQLCQNISKIESDIH